VLPCRACSTFLFLVMRRLLDIQGQLYAMRSLAKEAAAAQQQLLASSDSSAGTGNGGKAPAAGAGSLLEQQRLLSMKLTRLARSSEDGVAGKRD
jgi:hypothetical protein